MRIYKYYIWHDPKLEFLFFQSYLSFTLHFFPKIPSFFMFRIFLPSLLSEHTRGEETREFPLMNYFPLSSAAALKFPRFSVLLRILLAVRGSLKRARERLHRLRFNNFLSMTFRTLLFCVCSKSMVIIP